MASFLNDVSFQLEVPIPPPKDRVSTALCDAEASVLFGSF